MRVFARRFPPRTSPPGVSSGYGTVLFSVSERLQDVFRVPKRVIQLTECMSVRASVCVCVSVCVRGCMCVSEGVCACVHVCE